LHLLYRNPLEGSGVSNSAWSAKQSHGEKEQRTDQTQDSMNSNAENTKRQRQQPNQRIYYQREQRDGPAQDEQNAPQEESSHGNLVGEPSAITDMPIAKLRHSHTTTTWKPEKFHSL
jgi:hypothetical protein